MNRNFEEDPIILLTPVTDEEDISQEAAILQWQGKVPNRKILRQRAARFEALLFDFSTDVPGAEPFQWSDSPVADQETLQALTSFALSQSGTLQSIIFNFLEDPTEANLESALKLLQTAGVIRTDKEKPAPKPISLAEALLRYITEKDRTMSELYDFSRSFITSRRPEAAVRQTVRRLLKKNLIEENNNVYRRTH